MSSIDERSLGVARLYARAMLAVAAEQDAAESLGDELAEVVELAREDGEFGRFLGSPILGRDKRRASIEAALRGRASDLLVDSLQVINQKDRLAILVQILTAYRDAHREALGRVEVRVVTAVGLSDEQRSGVIERSRAYTGKEVDLVEKVDPEVLGGLVVQIGDQKVDVSVRRDIELLSARFAHRLSQELMEKKDFAIASDVTVEPTAGAYEGEEE